VSEYFLQTEKWPRTLPDSKRVLLQGIVRKLSTRPDLLGLAIGGSFVSDQMDDYSDLDLKVVVDEREWQAVSRARRHIAASVGPLSAPSLPSTSAFRRCLSVCTETCRPTWIQTS